MTMISNVIYTPWGSPPPNPFVLFGWDWDSRGQRAGAGTLLQKELFSRNNRRLGRPPCHGFGPSQVY